MVNPAKPPSKIPIADVVTIGIVTENTGYVTAENTRIILDRSGDYDFVASSEQGMPSPKLGNLMRGAKLSVNFNILPKTKEQIQVRYILEYCEPGKQEPEHRNEFEDVTLTTVDPNFKKIPNPYNTGLPVKETGFFVGRKDAITFAQDKLFGAERSNVLVFHGQRRMGKTSILLQLPQFVKSENCQFAYIDIQSFADVTTSTFLSGLADRIASQLEQAKLNPPRWNQSDFDKDSSGAFNRFVHNLESILNNKTI